MKSISVSLVLCADGSVNREASLASAESELDKYIAESESLDADISDSVHAVFDTHKGASLNMPYLLGQVLPLLKVTPANHQILTKRVQQFIRANAEGDNAVFTIKLGKGGGCFRNCDRAAK